MRLAFKGFQLQLSVHLPVRNVDDVADEDRQGRDLEGVVQSLAGDPVAQQEHAQHEQEDGYLCDLKKRKEKRNQEK